MEPETFRITADSSSDPGHGDMMALAGPSHLDCPHLMMQWTTMAAKSLRMSRFFEGATIAATITTASAPSSSATPEGVSSERSCDPGHPFAQPDEPNTAHDVPSLLFKQGQVPFRHVKELGRGSYALVGEVEVATEARSIDVLLMEVRNIGSLARKVMKIPRNEGMDAIMREIAACSCCRS
jgi:hypothetical protein